ncbi:MAG TPA: hypothetical protein VFQ43_00130, partial [Nitrososphaera sp.]|nr:hypothetical protein [Nitrososphaera sp.]
MARPKLKQFGELEPEDFERHPVWIGCHTADYGKAWYESTDEETFRPWTGNLPADLSEGMLLVKASFELRDGSRYAGFITPSDEPNELGTQQPQLFVRDQRFSFWGGMFGISGSSQQAFYAALNRDPKEIFPLRFVGDPKLATGVTSGQIDGFYIKGKSGIAVEIPERQSLVTPAGVKRYRVEGRNGRGFPQPEEGFKYKELNYQNICLRCGIFEQQSSPFRFKKSQVNPLSGFWQPQWIYDSFFVHPEIASEIATARITGVVCGPVLEHRTGTEFADRVQLLITKVVACVEVSHLPMVTCRPNNEEVTAIRKRWPTRPNREKEGQSVPKWWGDTEKSYFNWKKRVREERERFIVLPYCGRVKYHPPTSL